MSTYHGIEIKKSHKGLFTRKAKEHGSTPAKYAAHVLANKDKYTAETVKQANFARNARKFKHKQNGGDNSDQAASDLIKQYQQQNNNPMNGLTPPGGNPVAQPPVSPQQNAVNTGLFNGYMNQPYDMTPVNGAPTSGVHNQPRQYKTQLNPYVQDANVAIMGATAIADTFNNINNGRYEHQQYEKAIQPRPYRNNDQQGLNPLPAYTQYGGFGNEGMPYLPYLDPHYKQAIAPYQNGGDINPGLPYLPYLDPTTKYYPLQNGGVVPAYVYPPAASPNQGQPRYNFATGTQPTNADSTAYVQNYNAVLNGTSPNTPFVDPNANNLPPTSADNARFDAHQFLLQAMQGKRGAPASKDSYRRTLEPIYHADSKRYLKTVEPIYHDPAHSNAHRYLSTPQSVDTVGETMADFMGKQKQNGGDINEGLPYLPYRNPIEVYDPNAKYVFQNGGGPTAAKAAEILHDGTANGKPLTDKQRRYMAWVANGKKQNGGNSAAFASVKQGAANDPNAQNQPVQVNPTNAPVPVATPPVQPASAASNAPADDPDAYYKSNATLQYFKTQLNNQLQQKNPQGYQDYLGGLQQIQTDPTIPLTQKVAARQQYAQNSKFNDYLAPDEVKKSLGSDYDTYINSLKTVSEYNKSHGQQPLYGNVEGENDPTKLNYGRRFATITTNPSVDSTIKHPNGTATTIRKNYVYNPQTKQVELQQSTLQNGGYAEGQEVDLSPEEYQHLLSQGYELEQLDGSARPQMS